MQVHVVQLDSDFLTLVAYRLSFKVVNPLR